LNGVFLGGVNDAPVRNSCSLTALGQGQLQVELPGSKSPQERGARGADCLAVALFLKEVERLNREEATQAKHRPTLEDRLLSWCAQQKPPVARLSELDVETMRTRGPVRPPPGTISIGELSRSFFAWSKMDERESGQENQDSCSGAG
jgi:hypothetical protein